MYVVVFTYSPLFQPSLVTVLKGNIKDHSGGRTKSNIHKVVRLLGVTPLFEPNITIYQVILVSSCQKSRQYNNNSRALVSAPPIPPCAPGRERRGIRDKSSPPTVPYAQPSL